MRSYFSKNKLKQNSNCDDANLDYRVFNFSDDCSKLNTTKITENNIFSSMNDLMGDFNGNPDLQKFNLLFSKSSEN